ncbi:MAG: tRNA (adenosine(37)-N6)-threonylcarbamoyltransferase complex dimerization subunit type 1 TsaB [Ignavibacteriales bacterium]|nr:tRNA (adenosine(37)-N6)-threonylcarbamoyltransferase complex dimerization subunit type 1 TsaB [Ignavibacteriales bacterium]
MDKYLPILSIETSASLCSVALLLSADDYVELNFEKKHIHAEKIFTAIEQLFQISNTSIKDISSIAISMGPGSFTGLRIGMSVAKGLAFGRDIPIIPVPTFEAFAYQICHFIQDKTEFYIINDANIDEYYIGKFSKTRESYKIKIQPKLIKKDSLNKFKKINSLAFGNFNKEVKSIANPNAIYIAKWAYIFGKKLLTLQYDFLEPLYIKQFIPRAKK